MATPGAPLHTPHHQLDGCESFELLVQIHSWDLNDNTAGGKSTGMRSPEKRIKTETVRVVEYRVPFGQEPAYSGAPEFLATRLEGPVTRWLIPWYKTARRPSLLSFPPFVTPTLPVSSFLNRSAAHLHDQRNCCAIPPHNILPVCPALINSMCAPANSPKPHTRTHLISGNPAPRILAPSLRQRLIVLFDQLCRLGDVIQTVK